MTTALEPLTGIERKMALAYVQVHSRKINESLRAAEKGPPAHARTELCRALAEAQGVVAALERLTALRVQGAET